MTLSSHPAVENEQRFQRRCLLAAFLVTLLWGGIYLGYGNSGIEDEPGQMAVIEHFAQRRPGIPQTLPNLPGYHFLVILLSPDPPTLRSARLVTLGLALAGLGAFAAAWQRRHGAHPGGATLLLALLPIMQPFTAMVYTDVPAMAFLFAAFWAHFARRPALSAAFLACACLVRQTSLIWAAYLFVLEALEIFFPRTSTTDRPSRSLMRAMGELLERTRWLLLVLATAGGIILSAGRLTLGTAHGNRLEFNLATAHFGGLLVLLLGLPFWVRNASAIFRQIRALFRARPARVLLVLVLALGTAAFLAVTYANRYGWNRQLFWFEPGATFVLLRNWPLVWIERLWPLRVISGVVVVAMTLGIGWWIARQRCARELWLLLPFGALLLFSNALVEPRYFIPPCALALLFAEPGRVGLVGQVRWFGLLCVLQSPFILDKLALW